jgi:hypothetical protein
MSHGNEHSSLADVSHVSSDKFSLLYTELASELKDFVSQVTLLLSLSITLLEVSGDTSGCGEFPKGLVNDGFTATEHESSLLVSVDDSGSKEATFLSLAKHVSVNFISDFTKFDSTEGLPVELDGDSERFDTLDESNDNALSLFVSFAGRLDHVGHDESAVLVDDLHPLADLVLLNNDLIGSHTVSEVRELDAVTEENLAENEGRDLDSNRAGVGSGARGHFNNKCVDLRSLGHGVERQETETVLV